MLLDEALKHIASTDPPESVQSWIEYLSGMYIMSIFEHVSSWRTIGVNLVDPVVGNVIISFRIKHHD